MATTLIGGCGVFFSIYVWVNWVGRQLRQERDTAVHVQEELLHARGALQQANEELEGRVRVRTAELERANDALSESQEHLRAVITNAPVVLLALILLLAVVLDTRGATAIAFSFVGMPAVGLGILLYLVSLRTGGGDGP